MRGGVVVLAGRSQERLFETQKIINKANSTKTIEVDLSNLEDVNNFINKVKKKYNKIDVLLNIAGIWHGKNEVYAEKSYDSFNQKVIVDTFMVGTIAPSLLSHAFIPLMPEGSSIVNLSGTFESGAKGWLPYYVSKRAIEDLTVGLAQELKEKKIRVNCISPSDVATEAYKKYFPQYIKDAIAPEKIAEYALYLCSSDTKDVTGKVFVLKKDKTPFELFHA